LLNNFAKRFTLAFSQRSHVIRLSNKSRIRNIGAFRDELEKLLMVNLWQLEVVNCLADVLSPSTYRDASKGRVSLFKLESALLDDTAAILERQNQRFDDLRRHLEKLAELGWETRDIVGGNDGQKIASFAFVVAILCLGILFVLYLSSAYVADRDPTQGRQLETIALPAFGLVLFCGGILIRELGWH
jgi:hypothetical protein